MTNKELLEKIITLLESRANGSLAEIQRLDFDLGVEKAKREVLLGLKSDLAHMLSELS